MHNNHNNQGCDHGHRNIFKEFHKMRIIINIQLIKIPGINGNRVRSDFSQFFKLIED